jgi:NADH-quinone oxidoreductase subunit J
MLEATVFYTLAAFILGFGVLVITARNTVHSVLFLVANFLCVAMLYVTLGAEFLAVIQVLVYAGGIVVLYLFVVMLVNLKSIPDARLDPRRQSRLGLLLASAVLVEVIAIVVYTANRPMVIPAPGAASDTAVRGNTEIVGWLLYTDFLIPFEVASVLLLVAMVGAILLARREA